MVLFSSSFEASAPCNESCPVRRAAHLLKGKWTSQIVRSLLSGRKRPTELLAAWPGLSAKVLAARLQLLERNGLVVKTRYASASPHTDYTLTELGQRLQTVFEAMAALGEGLPSEGLAVRGPPHVHTPMKGG